MNNSGIKAIGPATISNIISVWNGIAVAVDYPAVEIIVSRGTSKEIKVTSVSNNYSKQEKETISNLAVQSIQFLINHLKINETGLNINIKGHIPFYSGLGLFEAIATASLIATSGFYKIDVEKNEIFNLLIGKKELKLSIKSLAAALFGGFQLVSQTQTCENIKHHRLPCPTGLYYSINMGNNEFLNDTISNLPTKQIERLLQTTSSFILGMNSTNLDLIKESLTSINDLCTNTFLYPDSIQKLIVPRGTLGIGITENNASIYTLTANTLQAQDTGNKIKQLLDANGTLTELLIIGINHEGADIC